MGAPAPAAQRLNVPGPQQAHGRQQMADVNQARGSQQAVSPEQAQTTEQAQTPQKEPGWRQGITATIPFTITVGALGIVFGATAGTVGLSGAAAFAMSVFVFSGAAQFSSLGLWHEGMAAVLLATALLGSRFLLMSASMALRLPGEPRWKRFLLANTIIDESYGLFMAAGPGAGASFLLGSMAVLYTPWLLGTWLGVKLGPLVPASWQLTLEAIFPLVFLVLVVLTSGSRAKAVVATIAAALAVACAVWLPGGWGLLIAGVSASAIGPWLARRLT